MLLDKELIVRIMQNSKNIEDAISKIDLLVDSEYATCENISVNYSTFIRGSRVHGKQCTAKIFTNRVNATQLVLYDKEHNSGLEIYILDTGQLRRFFNRSSVINVKDTE